MSAARGQGHWDRVVRALAFGVLWAAVPGPVAAQIPTAAAEQAARTVAVAPAADQRALAIELAPDGLWVHGCAERVCAARAGRRMELPPAALAGAERGAVEVLEPWPGRHVVHVRVPLEHGAWEALVAPGTGSAEPVTVFAGLTGPVEGEDGQRQGAMLWLRDEGKGARVLVGRMQEDVQLCGRPTILEPRLLDKDLSLRPVKVQRLTVDERRNAAVLEAVRAEAGPTPGGNALRAVVASSALGDPLALTDGRVDTSWAEGRGGEGRGEFVVLRPLSGVSLVSLELLVRAEGEVASTGTAPRSVWLVTRSSVRRIDWAEDAWQTPGVWYRVQLPAPLQEDCLALVLEQAYAETPETQVTLAELRGVSELQSLEPAQLVARLSTPGDAGSAAVPALLQAGPAGVDAVVNAFSALDAVGRARALDVLEGAPCESAARVYVDVLGDDDARVRRRAEQRLIACGDAASPELRRAFAQSSAEAGVDLARSITAISPALAVELIGARLAAVARQHRAEYRDVLSRAARHVDAEPELRRLLGTGGLGVAAEVDVLRALGDELPRFQPEASLTLARATSAAQGFAQRFLLLAPAAYLAPKDAGAASFVQLALTDPDPYLRQTAARAAPDVPPLRAALIAATRDEDVRVREASSVRIGELGLSPAAPALTERLSADRWPMVRGAAARSLASVGPSAPVDVALGKAALDAVDTVRSLALWSLGQRGARAQLPVVVGRLEDEKEVASVRAAAVRALAEMCDYGQLGRLTQAVARLGAERPSADDVVIGAAAAAALGRLSPPDLERRLAPLARAKAHPALEQILTSARQPAKRCASSPLPANTPRR